MVKTYIDSSMPQRSKQRKVTEPTKEPICENVQQLNDQKKQVILLSTDNSHFSSTKYPAANTKDHRKKHKTNSLSLPRNRYN